MSDIKDWDVSAANNNDPPPDGWPEGQLPSSVNNSARELMAAVKRGRLGVESLTHSDLPKTLTANDAGKFFLVDLSSATADETITLPAEATAGDGWNVTIQLTAVNGFDLLINNDAAATEFTLSTAETTVIPVTDGTSWFNRFVLDGSVVSALSGADVDLSGGTLRGHGLPKVSISSATNLNNTTHRSVNLKVQNATLTIVANSTTAYDSDYQAAVSSTHASGGTLTVVAGVTLNGVDGGSVTIAQYETWGLWIDDTDKWVLSNHTGVA